MSNTGNNDRRGRDHLELRSRLKLRIAELPRVTSVLIVDDVVFDADVLSSSLRLAFGADVKIAHVRTLRAVQKAVVDEKPQMVFLDDQLGGGATTESSLKIIREAGGQVPVIVISGFLTRQRGIALAKLGVADIVHKDDSNAVRLFEAIVKALESVASRATPRTK